MRRKIAGTVGSVLLCAVLLAGCSNTTTDTVKDTTKESASTQIASQSSQKFVSAENYQKVESTIKPISYTKKYLQMILIMQKHRNVQHRR